LEDAEEDGGGRVAVKLAVSRQQQPKMTGLK
jgi:hypothetical protein